MTRSTSTKRSSRKDGWTSTMATRSNCRASARVIGSTSMSRISHMATFSGRVMVPKVQMGVEVRLRPSRVLSASAEAMASGSGSSCIRIRMRAAPSKWARIRSRATALHGALERRLDHAIPECGQGHRDRPGKRRPILVAHDEHGCVGGGFGHGGQHPGVAGRACADDHGAAPVLERLAVEGRVREIAGERAVAPLAQAVPQRRPLDEIECPLAREGHASRKMTEQVVRADEHRPHRRFPENRPQRLSV